MLLLLLLVVGARGDQPCHDALSLPLPNASLRPDNGLDHDGLVYPQGTYWKAEDSYFGCPCKVTRCIRRCGGNETAPDWKNDLIVEVQHEDHSKSSVNAYTHFKVVKGKTCKISYLLEPDEYVIFSNGTLHLISEEKPFDFYHAEKFCVDMNKETSTPEVAICLQDEERPKKSLAHYIYPWFMIISAFFLLATIVAYLFAPEIRNLHGRCVVCHSACMMLGFVGLAVIQIEGVDVDIDVCRGLAIVTYYTLLATFFWLNVMCFDIWWTFRKLTGSSHQSTVRKFIMYCLYAFGVPFILFMVTITVELTMPDNNYKPNFGIKECWFQNFETRLLYFYGPICIILFFNLYFFIATSLKILRLKRETAVLKEGDSRKHGNAESQDKLRFKLYLKLFLVMGLSWFFEVISVAFEDKTPEAAWYFTDIINTLQGVFIFVFCVWFTKVRDGFVRKLFPRFAHKLSTQPGKSVTKTSEVSEGSSVGLSMKTISEDVARKYDY